MSLSTHLATGLSFKTIRAKATLFVLLLLSGTVVSSYVITLRIMNSHIRGEIIKRAESLSRSLASAAGYNLILQDLLALDNLIYKVKETNPDIMSIAILGPDKKVIVHSDARKAGTKMEPSEGQLIDRGADESSFAVESPIAFLNKELGSVILDVNWSVLANAQDEARPKILGVFAFILVLGVIISVLLSSRMTRPIKELASGVEELKHGQSHKRLRVYSADELGRLTESFNEMTGRITEQQQKLEESAHDLEEAYVSTVRVLAAAIEARDPYTLGHSTRVSGFAVELAQELGLSPEEVEEIEIACLFHDVGKIKIPDSILHKRGRLDPAQFKEMRRHPEYGAEILSKAPTLYKYIPAVRHHHEWYNGTGYPDGLSRDMIPAAAAIISLADAYDAMTSDRPYRSALTNDQALTIIREAERKQFNPDMAKAFLRILENQEEAVAGGAEERIVH
jgi:putative nucleotidyltransferase with HDIG domain